MSAELPIGVFDSGLGGLTVLKVLKNHLPFENFIYLGDTARIPYGSKSPRTIAKYSKQIVDFLIGQNVKAVIIACNSASTIVSELVAPVPLYDVIGPGAKTAVQITHNGRIGIAATKATVTRKAYPKEIAKLNNQFKVFQQACPLLVPLVEEGWIDDPVTNLIGFRYLSPLKSEQIDTLILGCTHYPVLKSVFAKVMGPEVELVDSGESLALQIANDIEIGKIKKNSQTKKGTVKFYSTDVSENYGRLAQLVLQTEDLINFELIELY